MTIEKNVSTTHTYTTVYNLNKQLWMIRKK